MISPQLVRDYRQFQNAGAYCTPPGRAVCALQNARTLDKWRKAERSNLVRLRAIPEEDNYFDVYGHLDNEKERKEIESLLNRWGCYCVISEVNHGDESRDDWRIADSVGMCVYAKPLDPFDNSYVIDLMRAALDAVPQPGEN
jgi:hypothetical protein